MNWKIRSFLALGFLRVYLRLGPGLGQGIILRNSEGRILRARSHAHRVLCAFGDKFFGYHKAEE